MASRSKGHAHRERDNDSGDSLKPLVVLVLLGTILYGAWSVVNKGPAGPLLLIIRSIAVNSCKLLSSALILLAVEEIISRSKLSPTCVPILYSAHTLEPFT
jgi:hypothetical protein